MQEGPDLAVSTQASNPTIAAAQVDFDRRFGGIARLYGEAALLRFRRAHVCVVGLGGVGSWAAEALARSGAGRLTLIDLDHVAESNVNRQIHALENELGRPKVSAMADRIRSINPECGVVEIEEFVSSDNVHTLIDQDHDFVIDAVDSTRAKAALIARCAASGVPVIVVGGAGGRVDPTRIRVGDLARTEHEPLLAKVRRRLRHEYGFPRGERASFGIEAVFSDEPVRYPADRDRCDTLGDAAPLMGLACAGYGSSVCVTAAFGLVAVARVLQRLATD